MRENGFTLIELLVVIAIIALLLSIIMPGLNLAKRKAASIVCMVNVKNLSLGWFSYKEDNNGNIMAARFDGVTKDGQFTPGWINTPYTATGTKLDPRSANVVTDEDEIRGIRDGALYPYLKSPDGFNCPADKVKALPIYDTVDPEKFVTYAIPVYLAGGTDYRITKFSEITLPSMRYNFVETAEERNFTVAAHWVFGAPEYTGEPYFVWWGPMAVNHGDSSVLGFCDGHAAVNKWRDPWTKERVAKLTESGTGYGRDTNSGHTSDNSVDLAFMAKGWGYRYKK
jgi:prepilin-type N-terminal cleavage/methylation domain-containing protein